MEKTKEMLKIELKVANSVKWELRDEVIKQEDENSKLLEGLKAEQVSNYKTYKAYKGELEKLRNENEKLKLANDKMFLHFEGKVGRLEEEIERLEEEISDSKKGAAKNEKH